MAIVGATGSGKSTIVHLINRFYDPWSGIITMDGVPLQEMSLHTIRKNIGLISQSNFLFNQSIENNIRLGNETVNRATIEEVCEKIKIDGLIKSLPQGYETVIGQGGHELSVGQKQLIAFARVLVFDPAIVILDEATSNIDTASEQMVLDGLDTLMAGRTTIAIAHRLSTIRKADRIIVIHKGEIREEGQHENLIKTGGIYATY